MQLKKFGPAGILNWIDLIDAQGSSRYPGELIAPNSGSKGGTGLSTGPFSSVGFCPTPSSTDWRTDMICSGGETWGPGQKLSTGTVDCLDASCHHLLDVRREHL